MRARTSPIWLIPNEEFIELVKNSPTMSKALSRFGLENKGNNYITFKARCRELNLDTSHFASMRESSMITRAMTLEILKTKLVEGSNIARSDLKSYLIRFNLIIYKCQCCGNTGTWQGKKISLQLEHKNGKSQDNRLENLSFLCPNCHSQTETYAGKKHKKIRLSKPKRIRPEKFSISAEELGYLISTMPFSAIGRKFGVSDNAIRKRAKKYGLPATRKLKLAGAAGLEPANDGGSKPPAMAATLHPN